MYLELVSLLIAKPHVSQAMKAFSESKGEKYAPTI